MEKTGKWSKKLIKNQKTCWKMSENWSTACKKSLKITENRIKSAEMWLNIMKKLLNIDLNYEKKTMKSLKTLTWDIKKMVKKHRKLCKNLKRKNL